MVCFSSQCSRFYLIYLTLVLHGIGTLMPWNMFITAKEVRNEAGSAFTTFNSCRPQSMQSSRLSTYSKTAPNSCWR